MNNDDLNSYIDSHFTPAERRRGAALRVMRFAACVVMTGLIIAGLVTVIMLLCGGM